MKKPTIIAPSLLAADLGVWREEIQEVTQGGADWLHIDVMDGRFVPPITFGDNAVALARSVTDLFLDVHLMIEEPEKHLDTFIRAGAGRVIVHQEVCPHLHRTLLAIREKGVLNGVALNPSTPVDTIFDVLSICDLVLIMTVNPGWGGQQFIPSCLKKIEKLSSEVVRQALSLDIEVDGGVNKETAQQCIQAGANVLVAGSSIFGAKDRKQAIAALRS